jgi:GTPase SAR1 family protein
MKNFRQLKEQLLQINHDIQAIIADAVQSEGLEEPSMQRWEKMCRSTLREISEETIRVAVVGPIKSGKSTFLNSMFRGDYVKRGAGVVTSIVTRVRTGKKLKAKLIFKSWDEVNNDIEQAMVLFPSTTWRNDHDRLDVRRTQDREKLGQALAELGPDHLITNDARNVNSVLISCYLRGYDRVSDIVTSDPVSREYRARDFRLHKDFAGDESLAVYLKDIELQINSVDMDTAIEIADCQGSDSPNPLHLAMIQDYLLLTHYIVYVISSRMGLRRADIKFLSMIKKMGIMDNLIFVLNCDFSEHESIESLEKLREKLREELQLIKPDPEIFTLSALYNLYKECERDLPEREAARLNQWREFSELADFSDAETRRFDLMFEEQFTGKRYAILLKNHMERVGIITSGLENWASMSLDIIGRDAKSTEELISRTREHRERMGQIKSLIKKTLDGAVPDIQKGLKTDIDRFFDKHSGEILGSILDFIRNYAIESHRYKENLANSGFTNTLYLVFQEFKQKLDAYMAETINPEVIRFAMGVERKIESHFSSIANPYDAMVEEALGEYSRMVATFEIANSSDNGQGEIVLPDMDSIKRISGLRLPALVTNMRYSAKIRTEAVLRLGFYTLLKNFKKLLRKPVEKKGEEAMHALHDAMKRIRQETEKSILFQFKDYRENIKFAYVFRLIEATSNILYEALIERFHAYTVDLDKTLEWIDSRQEEKEVLSSRMQGLADACRGIRKRLEQMREQIDKAG